MSEILPMKDSVGQNFCLGFVVRDVDGSDVPLFEVNTRHVGQFLPPFDINGSKRLVKKYEFGSLHKGSAESDPLSFASRELSNSSLFKTRHAEGSKDVRGKGLSLLFSHFSWRTQTDVLTHGEMGVQDGLLKQHGDAGVKLTVRKWNVVEKTGASVERFQTAHDSEQGCFSTAARPEN